MLTAQQESESWVETGTSQEGSPRGSLDTNPGAGDIVLMPGAHLQRPKGERLDEGREGSSGENRLPPKQEKDEATGHRLRARCAYEGSKYDFVLESPPTKQASCQGLGNTRRKRLEVAPECRA